MATADELKAFEMVADHEQRLIKIERALAEQLAAKDIEDDIAKNFPETVPQRKKKG